MGDIIVVDDDADNGTDTAADVHAEHAEEAAEEAEAVADDAQATAEVAASVAFDAQAMVDQIAGQVNGMGELTALQFDQVKEGLSLLAGKMDEFQTAVEANTAALLENNGREVIQEVAPVKDALPDEHKGHFLNRRLGRN